MDDPGSGTGESDLLPVPLPTEAHPAAELFPLLDGVGLAALTASILEHGLREPIALYGGRVLDGRNRLRACIAARITPRFIEVPAGENPWSYAWDKNAQRRHLDPMRLAALGLECDAQSQRWLSRLRTEAQGIADRTRSEKQKGVPKAEARERLPSTEGKRSATANAVADRLGVSRATVERAAELKRKAPELFEKVKTGEVQGRAALREVKRQERVDRLVEVSKGNTPLTGDLGTFPVIYADPPWRYDNVPETEERFIEEQYPTMSLLDICQLPVGDIATDDAWLFLWATSPLLPEAMRVMDSWGFKYKTCAVWVKDRIGMGYVFRQRHELLLVGVRGSPPTPPPAARLDSVIEAPRGKHSEKPGAVAAAIERMFPELPRVELFARDPRAGWKSWGNQSGNQ